MDSGSLPIGPGIGAFFAFFGLAVALYFLVRSMNRHLRRMSYAERDRVGALRNEGSEGAETPDDSGDVTDAGTDTVTDTEAGEVSESGGVTDEDSPKA